MHEQKQISLHLNSMIDISNKVTIKQEKTCKDYQQKTHSSKCFQDANQFNQTIEMHSIMIGDQNKKQLIYYHPVKLSYKKELILNKRFLFHPGYWSLENFQIGRHLGRGKYGHVYLVRQKKTKLIMALKVLSKLKVKQDNNLSQIRRQLEIHSHLHHPNILEMYGFFFDDKRIYIMMEYSTKGDLYDLLKVYKKFDQNTVRRYMRQMINVFHYLQQLNIIHRDIKPQNIMVSYENTLKLSDFGWAIKSKSKYRETFCGTLDYFCPEIIRYRPFDCKVDNWSLGILAYELLCGKTPFCHGQRKKMFDNILKCQILYPKQASFQFRDFVNRLTRKDPRQRMQLKQAILHPWLLREQMDIQK